MSTSFALFVGDITVDSIFRIPCVPEADEKVIATGCETTVGGMAVNAAIACQRGGISTRLMVQIADDPVSADCLDVIAGQDVVVLAATTGTSTAQVTVLVAPDGEKRLVLFPGDSMYPALSQAHSVSLVDVAWVHHAVYDIEAASELVHRSRQSGIPWSLDLEPSTFPQGIGELASCLRGADTVFCNAASLKSIGPSPLALLFSLGVRHIVETRGAAGASLHRAKSQPVQLSAPATVAMDTTGAGDCLAGRYIAARLGSQQPAEALKEAIDAASDACQRPGSWTSYPPYKHSRERTTATK